MKPEWILVANASQARLLQREPGCPLVVLQSFHHPASREHSSTLGDSAAGRQRTDRAFGAAAFEPRADLHRKEHLKFAAELAEWLEEGARDSRYAGLQVFASSPFLGELKQHLGDATQRLLQGAHDVDLSAVGLTEMERRIEHALRPAP
jgi:protein required for attachment to host cells